MKSLCGHVLVTEEGDPTEGTGTAGEVGGRGRRLGISAGVLAEAPETLALSGPGSWTGCMWLLGPPLPTQGTRGQSHVIPPLCSFLGLCGGER